MRSPQGNWCVYLLVCVCAALTVGCGSSGGSSSTSSSTTSVSTSGSTTGTTTGTTTGATAADIAGQGLSAGKCTGTDKPPLTRLPMDIGDYAVILPYGLMVGGHVTPIDHQYFPPIVFNSAPNTYPVYAIANSYLHEIQTRTHPGQGAYSNQTITDYRLVFSVSCRLLYYYDLVTELAPGLAAQLQASGSNLRVTSGQLIGRVGNQTLDFAVWDTDKPLTRFIVPDHYKGERWKIYTADPLDYYDPVTKAEALSKYIRTAAPTSGRIDYDVDGFLIGNWFRENADGSTAGYSGSGGATYWDTHLAFAPHFLDPSTFIISIGNWPLPEGASQFVAAEGAPDPATVDRATGLVKYTLAGFEPQVNGQRWDGTSKPAGPITIVKQASSSGCFLVQMLGTREIQAEAFPGRVCAGVTGFTSAALKYIR